MFVGQDLRRYPRAHDGPATPSKTISVANSEDGNVLADLYRWYCGGVEKIAQHRSD
jgi:hypothetical protein